MLTNVSLTIFSRIPKGQSAAIPGTYSDSIIITVTY
jgi:spore coat protein U-like protein